MGVALLQQLNADHKVMARILYCLQMQIKGFENLDFVFNSSQILDILDYISFVPERWHHPVEDIIFKRMLQRAPPHPSHIVGVLSEHEGLEQLTEELKVAFRRVTTDSSVPVAQLYQTATIYLTRQMLHLDAEETVLFPLAQELLTESDWTELEMLAEDILNQDDELTHDSYDHLRDSILNFEQEPYQSESD